MSSEGNKGKQNSIVDELIGPQAESAKGLHT